mmetsp:Transcript_3155/g.7093  ORF Transcript_3155/g.7093 Transcript_3155/m.7093 type:complete len:233 (-) Transcript_3155:66-764(-)
MRFFAPLVVMGAAMEEDVSHSKSGNCMLHMRGSITTAPLDGADVDPASAAVLSPGAELVDWEQLVEAEAHHPEARTSTAVEITAEKPGSQAKAASAEAAGAGAATAAAPEKKHEATARAGATAAATGEEHEAPVLLTTKAQAMAMAKTTAQRAWSGFKWFVVTFGNPAHGPLGYAPLSTLQAKSRKPSTDTVEVMPSYVLGILVVSAVMVMMIVCLLSQGRKGPMWTRYDGC